MVNVDSSYLESAGAASAPITNQPSSFFRTMLALAVVDVLMLFWILNPLSKPSNTSPSWHRLTAPQVVHAAVVAVKPSPLGAVAKQVPNRSRSVQSARTYNSAGERRFVTVAYRD